MHANAVKIANVAMIAPAAPIVIANSFNAAF